MAKIYSEVQRMSNLHLVNNKPKKNNSKGFYIALGVCLIAIGVAAWTTYDSVVNYAEPEENVTSSQTAKETNETVSGIKVIAGENSTTKTESSPKISTKEQTSKVPAKPSQKQPVKQTAAAPLKFISPVDKAVTQKFSGKNLIFSKTMQDWRSHDGTDFGAKKGDTVKAVTDGKVKDIYKDDLYGNTVVMLHGDIETYYCGLNDVSVKKNDEVKQGQKVGTIGDIPFECEDAPHLHLEMKKNNKLIEPLSVIK